MIAHRFQPVGGLSIMVIPWALVPPISAVLVLSSRHYLYVSTRFTQVPELLAQWVTSYLEDGVEGTFFWID